MDNSIISSNKNEHIFAEICVAYIEILAGIRGPDQLARWLSDKSYVELCHKAKSEARARQVTGAKARPDICVLRSKIFLSAAESIQGVVVIQISGKTRAVSIRAERLHDRFRVTDLALPFSS